MAVAHLVKRDLGGRLRALGSETRLAQNERQRHGEAGGVSGADQFLRVAAGLALEPAGETVGIGLQRAALGRDRAFAVLDAAAPGGRTMGFHRSLSFCFQFIPT